MGSTKMNVTLANKNCYNCGAHERHLVYTESDLVCGECAMVQPGQLFDYSEFTLTRTLKKRHVYSRRVYFFELIRNIRGEKKTAVSAENYKKLKKRCKHIPDYVWRKTKANTLIPILKSMKLGRLKGSRCWLAFKLSRGIVKPTKILKKDYDRLAILFNQVEKVYKTAVQLVDPKRKIFMNYCYLYTCLVHYIGKPEYAEGVQLPKNSKSRVVQCKLWRAICVLNRWRWIPIWG